MRNFITVSLLLIITFFTMAIFVIKTIVPASHGDVAGKSTIYYPPITISARIGAEGQFNLFGYTSPQALVSLDAIGAHDETRADQNGYFAFTNHLSPFFPQESCLTAQDQLGRLSTPTCLPPFPNNYDVEVGPIILPPTTSFDKSDYFVGDEVLLTGQTIPNTHVDLSMFAEEKDSSRIVTLLHGYIAKKNHWLFKQLNNLTMKQFNLIKTVNAFSFPELTTKSDSKGNFSIALPSSASKTYRLFTQTNFQTQASPKSTTLKLKILPVWMIVIKIFLLFWSIIKSRLLELIIIIEIIAVVHYLLKYYFQPHQLMIVERRIVKRENYLPIK